MLRAFALLLVSSTAAVAEDWTAALGRIELTPQRACSAVLIEPDLIATAAHCAGRVVDGTHTRKFRTGTIGGKRGALFRTASGAVHPLYDLPGQGNRKFRFDIAVLRLSTPVPAHVARPLALGSAPTIGETVVIGSWRDHTAIEARRRPCPVIPGAPGIVTLECRVDSGESGGAVLRLTDRGAELVGIVTSTAKVGEQRIAQAVAVDGKIRPILDRLPDTFLENQSLRAP